VELEIERDPESRIPLRHGLPGTLEIEVDRVSPAALVARSIGRVLTRPTRTVADAG
jgi:membrane fusion protein (multidrug efflux system)